MKLSHFASAAATVLVLGSAAPAFAQTGFIQGYWGENRDKSSLQNSEQYGFNGAVSLPVGPVEFSVEASFNDTGRDSLSAGCRGGPDDDTATGGIDGPDRPTVNDASTPLIDERLVCAPTVRNGTLSFDQQTFVAGSIDVRNDKMAYGARVAAGQVGQIANVQADPNDNFASVQRVSDITLIQAGGFVQTYQDKWVGSASVMFGHFEIGKGSLEAANAGDGFNEDYAGPFTNRTPERNFLDVTLDGNFFFTDNAMFTIGVDYKDMESDDPVFSNHIGVEWRKKDSPFGFVTNIEFSKHGNSVTVGLVGNFGADTLNDRVRKGPAMPFVNTLRNYSNLFVEGP